MEVKINNYTLQHTQNDLFALYNRTGRRWVFLCVALTFKGKFYMKRRVKSPVSQYITHADVSDDLLHDYLHTEISRIVME